MTRQIQIGDSVVDQFPAFAADGYTKVSGLTIFTATVWKDGIVQATAVAITEIGSSGDYRVAFTPDAVGFWRLEVLIDYNKDIWHAECEVGQDLVEFGASMADDDANVVFGVWLEIRGVRKANLDSMSAKIMDTEDNEIFDLGTDNTPTSDGVFRFSTAVSVLTKNVPYFLALVATEGSVVWNGNAGFVRV